MAKKTSPLQTVKPGLDRHGLEGSHTSSGFSSSEKVTAKLADGGGKDKAADYGNQNKNPTWPHDVTHTTPTKHPLGVPGDAGAWTSAKGEVGAPIKNTAER